jgi:hypothetical protein
MSSNLFESSQTFLNQIKTLTPKQLGDKVDLFLGHAQNIDNLFAISAFTVENSELSIFLVTDVPEGRDPQEFVEEVIIPEITAAMHRASLKMRRKVATQVFSLLP